MANTEVIAAIPEENRLKLKLSDGSQLTVDQVVLAVGVEPNTTMAEKSDLEVDPDFGGYLVNTELQARSNLFIVSCNDNNAGNTNYLIQTNVYRKCLEGNRLEV